MAENSPIRIAIGTEPMQHVPCQVLKSSILSRTEHPVEFLDSWDYQTGWHEVLKKMPKIKRGTKFSTWRWVLPDVYPEGGRVIYLDADMVCLTDICELWQTEFPNPHTCLAAVKNAVGVFGKKVPELGKVQTSVMVMDLARCTWSPELLLSWVRSKEITYKFLMQAGWIPDQDIVELEPEWNHFGIHTEETKIIHWSHVASQPYRNPGHQSAWVFGQELETALELGHLSAGEVKEAAEFGYLHPDWAAQFC